MSNKKKPKKLRTPNLAAAGLLAAAEAKGGGTEAAAARPMPTAAEPRRVEFDYTYVRQDLRRILILAGSLIVVLVALSFVLR
ncbi:MAG: hypothetical protein IT317_04985 [Anaerolineales bacterium]|nr:hypothetical protein [Anaerolineales bacterium]